MPTMPSMPNLPIPGSLRPRRASSRDTAMPWIPVVERSSAIVDCAVYRDGRREPTQLTWQQAVANVRGKGSGFVWIGLHEPSTNQLSGIATELGLHPLAVEDAVHAHQRPKLDRYEQSLFAVVKTVHYNSTDHQQSEVVETGEVMVFLGQDFVVTVRHGEFGGLHRLRLDLEADPSQLSHGPSVVLHAVLDHAVDEYLQVSKSVQRDIDEIETAVFDGVNRGGDTNRIYLLKREVVELGRCVGPLRPALRALADGPMPAVAPEIRDYFRDVEDHLQQVAERVASYDDLLNTLVSANLAQVGVVQNEDMRKISAWVAIGSIPTMFAGIYGMNFQHMPELHWEFGYPTVLVVIATICLSLHRAFKRNDWL
jgi:magnesium transporter